MKKKLILVMIHIHKSSAFTFVTEQTKNNSVDIKMGDLANLLLNTWSHCLFKSKYIFPNFTAKKGIGFVVTLNTFFSILPNNYQMVSNAYLRKPIPVAKNV